jgi:hypothetical protein
MANLEPLAAEQIFRFNPRWWWDPVPDWVLGRLDRDGVLAVAFNHLEVHKAVIDAQAKALDQTREILTKYLQR